MTAKIYKSDIHNANIGAINTPVHPGGDEENILNGLTYNYWKPIVSGATDIAKLSINYGTQVIIKYFAFDAHNIDDLYFLTGVRLRASNDNIFTTSVILAEILKADIVTGANIKEFVNSTPYRYYMLEVYHTANLEHDPVIGVFYMGTTILELPEDIKPSYTPPKLGIKSEILNNVSAGGNSIGRSLKRTAYNFNVKNENIEPAWIESNWLDLINYIEQYPFFYVWNDAYINQGVLAWTDGQVKPPVYQDNCFLKFSFKCIGYRSDEPR